MTTAAKRRVPAHKIIGARTVPIADELERRSIIELRRVGKRNLEGACPICREGNDRFGVDTARNVWTCRKCPPIGNGKQAGGDVIALVQHLDRCSFAEAVEWLTGDVGPSAWRPVERSVTERQAENNRRTDEDEAARIRSALGIWREAHDVRGTVAARYLASRGLKLPPRAEGVLRFHPSCLFGPGVRYPCLVALYRDITTNEPRGIHRTALTGDGCKIGRMTLGLTSGAAIKLSPDDEVEGGLTIGEGIETTLRGMMFGLRPAWALGCASAIKKFPILTGIEALTILVDNDANGTGQGAARHCAERWSATRREVRLIKPNARDTDIADILSESAR
jgi:hypothetical protein